MSLRSVTVGGLRNLGLSRLDLEGITAVVSANNYGKTNLMTALGLASTFIVASPKERMSIMSSSSFVPLVTKLQDDSFHFEMELEDPDLGEYRFVKYSFSFAWIKDDGSGCRITEETIELKEKASGKWTNYLKRDAGKYRKSHISRSFSSIVLDGSQLAIDILTSLEDIDINPAIRKIKEAAFIIFDALDAQEKYSASPLEFGDGGLEGGIALNDDDLPRSLYRLKKLNAARYDDFLAAVYTLFPSFESFDVDMFTLQPQIRERLQQALESQEEVEGEDEESVPFKIRDELYRIQVKDSHLNQPVDIRRMSAGTQRIVWLVANAMLSSLAKVELIGMEELETSIHPQLLRTLLETLYEYLGDTRLLVSSHSPALIQYLKPSQIYVGVPNDEGIAEFRRIDPKKLNELVARAYENGLGFGEYLFELMSSEQRGARILLSYLEV